MALRIIPVLDIRLGQAVRALGGHRSDYRPIQSILRPGSDPIKLAEAIRETFGYPDLYLADLDAIEGRGASSPVSQELIRRGFRLWVDAGIRSLDDLTRLLDAGVETVVVGLETWRSPHDLNAIVALAGKDRVVFSLDLREGKPIFAPGSAWSSSTPLEVAEIVCKAGFGRCLILDLTRVGMGQGTGTLPLLRELSSKHPGIEWSLGGGIDRPGDLAALEDAGASVVLVGSALHDGRFAGIIDPQG